jgi:hypothetical protein
MHLYALKQLDWENLTVWNMHIQLDIHGMNWPACQQQGKDNLSAWNMHMKMGLCGIAEHAAAQNGHFDCLKYAHENGCEWNNNTCEAIVANHLLHDDSQQCLKYLHKNGCEWDAQACKHAALNGHLCLLQYAHKQDVHGMSRQQQVQQEEGMWNVWSMQLKMAVHGTLSNANMLWKKGIGITAHKGLTSVGGIWGISFELLYVMHLVVDTYVGH